jgi:AcrR family transcriptional regulator
MDPQRADRILGAAAELLLRWGYPKVTVDDIARAAGVGKGTVYLHWPTKQELFATVLAREGLAVLRELVGRMRAAAGAALPGPMLAEIQRLVLARPLSRAFYTGDTQVLGQLVSAPRSAATDAPRRLYAEYLRLLQDHALVRTDLDVATLLQLLESVSAGFFRVPGPPAELLADAVDRVLAPATPALPEDPGQLQAPVVALVERMCDELGAEIDAGLRR